MRQLLALALIAFFAPTLTGAGKVPRKAPEFVITAPDGKQILLSQYRGKPVVLAMLFTTCSHCQKTAGVLAVVQKEYEKRGVQVLGTAINDGASREVAGFIKGFGVNYPFGVSPDRAAREFLGLTPTEPFSVPILVFIDKTGMIQDQRIGDDLFQLRQEINIRKEVDKLLTPAVATKPAKKS